MAQVGKVTANVLNVRSGAGTNHAIVTKIRRGTVVDVLEAVNSAWSRIRLKDGQEAYVATAYLIVTDAPSPVETTTTEPASPPSESPGTTTTIPEAPVEDDEKALEPFKVAITARSLRVRGGPGTTHDILGRLRYNEVVTVLEDIGDWFRIDYAEGKGHVHSAYVRKLSAEEESLMGYLIEDESLLALPLEPEKKIPLDGLTKNRAIVAARIWNMYGGLIGPLAEKLDIPVGAMVGIIGTESGGHGYAEDTGALRIRFENHVFYDEWGQFERGTFFQHFQFSQQQGRRYAYHKFRKSTSDVWRWVHAGDAREREVLAFARIFNDEAALKSISMGAPQIMGFNYTRLGYESVHEMYEAFTESAHAQILGLFDFVKGPSPSSPPIEALRLRNFKTFIQYYNGYGLVHKYEPIMTEIAAYYNTLMHKVS